LDKKEVSYGLFLKEGGFDYKKHERTFWGGGNVLSLDHGDGHTIVALSKLIDVYAAVNFILYKLH
jgi:hypothetical protein